MNGDEMIDERLGMSDDEEVPMVKARKTRKKIGGAIPIAAAIQLSALLAEMLKPFIASVASAFDQLVNNPAWFRYKHAYVDGIPNLSKRYMLLENTKTFLSEKPTTKLRTDRINSITRKQADIYVNIKTLLMKIPRLLEISQANDARIKERDEQKAIAENNKLTGGMDALDAFIKLVAGDPETATARSEAAQDRKTTRVEAVQGRKTARVTAVAQRKAIRQGSGLEVMERGVKPNKFIEI
jgi:hypothetical protein